MRRVLCDTCALIWLATGDAKLSRVARNVIRDAELLCFSSISIWDVFRHAHQAVWHEGTAT